MISIPKTLEKMEWNTYLEDFNDKRIKTYNIFTHSPFCKDIAKITKVCKSKLSNLANTFPITYRTGKGKVRYKEIMDEYLDKVNFYAKYYFHSKCEYEVIISDWPPSPPEKEFKELKVSVYDQIALNWNRFIDYLMTSLFTKEELV